MVHSYFLFHISVYGTSCTFICSYNYNAGTPETDLYIVYFIDGTLRIRSRSDQGCYLCFENNTFQSCSSLNSNDIFERVQVDRDHVALRVIRQNSSQLGVGAPEEEESTESDKTSNVQMESDEPQEVVSDCYLGFDENTCKPKCYNSAQFKETLFRIYELR